MDAEVKTFHPPRRRGLILNIGVMAALSLLAIALLVLASQTALGPGFLGFLLGALVIAVPLPLLANRVYALINSSYQIERDGIRLKWGFREVDIPITAVEYCELAEDLLFPLEFPRMQWPGAMIGTHRQDQLGQVEFLASERAGLVMIGTGEHVYVISPQTPKQFVAHYRKVIEMGSLSPLPAYSAAPSFLLLDFWRIPRLRIMLVLTVVFSLALFAFTAWAVPTLEAVSLGFDAALAPLPPVSPGQLFLLPAMNILLIVASYLLSLLFFRSKQDHPFVSVMWFSNTLTSALFLFAVLFILRAS